jgi:prevent-host-death family protein
MVMKKTISAAAFKAHCLKLMDQVNAQRAEVVITKRGKPVARLVPIETAPTSIFGCMVGDRRASRRLAGASGRPEGLGGQSMTPLLDTHVLLVGTRAEAPFQRSS